MRTMHFVIALAIVMGLHGTSRASEPCCETRMTHSSEEMARADEAAILRAMQDYAEGSIRADADMLVDLWDASAAERVSFIPVEVELPLIGLENFRAYAEGFMAQLVVLSGDVTDVQIHRVGDMAYASCRFNWVYRSVAGGPVMAQPTRATFVLRKHGKRWLYLHFHESITFQPGSPQ